MGLAVDDALTTPWISTERVHVLPTTDPTQGRVVWAPVKSLWFFFHLAVALFAAPFWVTWGSLAVFLALTAITICAGHSVGMHRLLIHRSFKCPKVLEYFLVWLGTLVGMAGPWGMIRAHDLRDWHQRQTVCPPHPSHGAGFWRDAWWQLHCEYRLEHPPEFRVLPDEDTPVYRWLNRTWMAQQVPLALVLLAFGGWAWVVWGVSVRVAVSLIGHWAVGHFAHRRGTQGWKIQGLPVQGFNIPRLGWLTFGENWHGNHHAFPHSARLGLDPGQADPGFAFIKFLERIGWAWDIQTPDSQPERAGLVRV